MMEKTFPFFSWIKSYKTAYLKGDFNAGVTVGIMLIPQGMAYAMIAGLPPVYGLYAALVPQIVYAFLGTSRQLAVGPVAMDSLLVASGLGAIANLSEEKYIALAIVLALYMGVIQLVLGKLKLGFVVQFLSKPVISGFTSATAIIIGLSQLNHLLGVSLPRTNQMHRLVSGLLQLDVLLHPLTFMIGISGVALLLILKKSIKNFPAALVLVLGGVFLSESFNWQEKGIKVVENIPGGLPSFTLPAFSLEDLMTITPLALTLALVAFMEAIAVAKAVEEKKNTQELNPNQELVALGMANIVGAFFQSYPTTGGFSRTAVNEQAGAKSGIASLMSALVVGLTLAFFTSFFYALPKTLLASIIMVAVFNLIDFNYPLSLWKTNRSEFYILLFTFITTLFVGITQGVLLGVLVALLYMIYTNSSPHIAVLGRIKNTPYFKNILRFPNDIETYPGVLIVRFDGPLFFGNQSFFKQEMNRLIEEQKEPVKYLIIDAIPIHDLDATSLHMLFQWAEEIKKQNIQLCWARVIGPIRDRFLISGFSDYLGPDTFFPNIDACLAHIEGEKMGEIQHKITQQTFKIN